MAPTSPGTAIRRARERKRWKQEDLAKALGVSQRTVSEWENDRASPRSSTGAIEQLLGISLSGGHEQDQSPGIPGTADLPDHARHLITSNYSDEAVRIIWSREHISRDARLGLIAWYVGLRDAANGG